MIIDRIASVPLILHDPYFSIWCGHDHLYDGDTTHWCGKKHRMCGYVTVDEKTYCFMGNSGIHPVLEQRELEVTATRTIYRFQGAGLWLKVEFCSPLLLEDPVLLSRPCTYIEFEVEQEQEREVTLHLVMTDDLVSEEKAPLCGGVYKAETFTYAVMGKVRQTPLGHSGDHVTMDWGNLYLACGDQKAGLFYDQGEGQLRAAIHINEKTEKSMLVAAYDDLQSIQYFGNVAKAFWKTKYAHILEAVKASLSDHDKTKKRCVALDEKLEKRATDLLGNDYALLCNASYRHAIAAHKLVTDEEGRWLFLSKENDSNGCIGTVDISYPSMPLFLLYNTEYVKGMLRPIFRFADCDVWEYDFAPHDVGRYPYATGQVYGLKGELAPRQFRREQKDVLPFFYMFPKGADIYDLADQMPVEECGNMLIMTAVVCTMENSASFALPHMEVLEQWTKYLLTYGRDPGEQLCTDDFAGHLSHNVNLSAKAIMGVEAYAVILRHTGRIKQAQQYHEKAKDMAKDWEKRAVTKDHTRLTFDQEDSWSLKYNLVWDRFFGSGLFDEALIEREIDLYLEKANQYGVPLDSRKDYTKSDWILWCAAMCRDEKKKKELIKPIALYLKNTKSRVPFSDWYETKTGESCSFIARSVQGGIFMPLFLEEKNK